MMGSWITAHPDVARDLRREEREWAARSGPVTVRRIGDPVPEPEPEDQSQT